MLPTPGKLSRHQRAIRGWGRVLAPPYPPGAGPTRVRKRTTRTTRTVMSIHHRAALGKAPQAGTVGWRSSAAPKPSRDGGRQDGGAKLSSTGDCFDKASWLNQGYHFDLGVEERRGKGGAVTSQPPGFEPGDVFDLHVSSEFVTKDLIATMDTMTDHPTVTHVPTLAGGVGAEEVRSFYSSYFIGHWPEDTKIVHISRTIGSEQLVDEMVMHFTHDRVMETFLPGVEPTGATVRLPVVVVAGFAAGKVAFERIYWDQASLLAQIGALNDSALPITGDDQAAKLLDMTRPCNELIARAEKSTS
jgi:carboxymethylenebutenolidase